MKKILMLLIVALTFSASAFAQYQSHWVGDYSQLSNVDYVVAFVKIDGEFVTINDNWDDLEVAAFVGDVVRGTAFMDDYTEDDIPYPSFELPIYYENSNEAVSFKLYDHANNIEYGFGTSNYEITTSGLEHVEIYDYDFDNALVFSFTTPSSGFEKGIVGYNSTSGNGSNWYLVASPVGEVTPSADNGFITEAFDLYWFDQNPADGVNEWMNYEATSDGFPIEPGKGYLYASADTTTLVFTGNAYTTETGELEVPLAFSENTEFSGWNLVGNPFGGDAYIGTAPYYRMKDDGTDLITDPVTGTAIAPMEGVFVVATGSGKSVTFTTTPPTNPEATLALNLSRDSKVVDRAVVSFGQERSLPKFQLNPNHTKVYIPQESRDYAVVTAGEMGEMPVGFKAEKNGSYTLDFTAQEVSFAYLHLIDNKTGKDVDLLESPAYSFDALTTDYASRFKLVFATGNNSDDNFAFNSNGNWIISNDGEATLQVVDVTGRILSSETVSGCVSKAISAAPGVYMLRLINGDNMKVQKVVVK